MGSTAIDRNPIAVVHLGYLSGGGSSAGPRGPASTIGRVGPGRVDFCGTIVDASHVLSSSKSVHEMTARRTQTLQQLIERSLYPVDEGAIAEAILLRAAARRMVPDLDLRSAGNGDDADAVRSFRHDTRARSFRLASGRPRSARR
jgi:hypothetical protein